MAGNMLVLHERLSKTKLIHPETSLNFLTAYTGVEWEKTP